MADPVGAHSEKSRMTKLHLILYLVCYVTTNVTTYQKMWSMYCTMLQKLSDCEVKAARNEHCSNLLPLRFYVKSNFGELKWSKNVTLANFRDSEL